MKSFRISFRGLALGGQMVITAANEAEMYKLALEKLNEEGSTIRALLGRRVVEADIDIDATKNFTPYAPTIHLFWDGDY